MYVYWHALFALYDIIYACGPFIHVGMQTAMCVSVLTWEYASCMCICIKKCVNAGMHVGVFLLACMHAYIHECMPSARVYACMHVGMHTCMSVGLYA